VLAPDEEIVTYQAQLQSRWRNQGHNQCWHNSSIQVHSATEIATGRLQVLLEKRDAGSNESWMEHSDQDIGDSGLLFIQ